MAGSIAYRKFKARASSQVTLRIIELQSGILKSNRFKELIIFHKDTHSRLTI